MPSAPPHTAITAYSLTRRGGNFNSCMGVAWHLQPDKRRLDVGKAALYVPPFARDIVVGYCSFRDRRPIDVQHTQVLNDRQRAIEQRSRTGDAHANHPDNHVASPLSPIACATTHRANSSTRSSAIAVMLARVLRWEV